MEEHSREVRFRCAPNPAGEYLEVIWEGVAPASPAAYQAVGADGRVYLQVNVEGLRQQIGLQGLPPGWYVLRLLGDGTAAAVPFLKH